MSDFDPTQFLNETSSDEAPFDPKAFLEETKEASKIETGIMHGLQGAVGGFLDEASGLGEAAGRAVGVKGIGGSFDDVGLAEGGPTLKMDVLKEAYLRARDKKRKVLDAQKKDHPGIANTANVAGMIVSPLNKATKGLSLARGGGLISGINALGNSEADNLGDMAIDTAIGYGTGVVVGKGVDKASPYIKAGADKIGRGSRNLAERFAARALGAERGTIKSLGPKKVMSAAGQALDEGVLSPLASTDDLIARNSAAKSKGGKLMGEAYNAIDEAGASTFNPLDTAAKVDEGIGGFWRSPINKGETNQLENTIESILMRGEGNIPLKQAQLLKEELGSVANWKNNLNITDKEKMAREAYRIVSQQIDDAVEKGAAVIDKAGLSGTLQKGKDLYANASTAEKLLGNKHAREQGNNLFGLTDTITGAGALGYGGTTGDWQTAGGVMLAKKGLQKYGSQNAALALNKVSKMLMKTPKFAELAQNNPKAFNALASSMAQRIKPQGGMSKVAGPGQQPVDEEQAKQSFLEGN